MSTTTVAPPTDPVGHVGGMAATLTGIRREHPTQDAEVRPLDDVLRGRFDSIYAEAGGDASRIPWARLGPSPSLVNWLNAVGPTLVRCGARIAVVGCGLGEDARELMRRGYDVTAFDCSAAAVAWARSLDPQHAVCYCEADLLSPPIRWRHRFDLVVEVRTVQSLPPSRRGEVLAALADLVAGHGHLLVIGRRATGPVDETDGPPWPIDPDELVAGLEAAGMVAEHPVQCWEDEPGAGEDSGVARLRGLFRRA